MTPDCTKNESEPVGEVVRIFRRGWVWWANYQHGGRQHRQSLKTTSKKEATLRAVRLEADLADGRRVGPAKPASVDAAIAQYVEYLEVEGRSAKTLVKYKAVLVRLAAVLAERRAASLLDLNRGAVDAYRHARVKAGAAAKTVYTETVIVRQLVNFALERGLIADDPLRGLKIREPKPKPQPCWTAEEVERILEASPASHRSALTILADTGMRFGELAHLTWDDVDFGRNVLHVRPKGDWRPKTGDCRAIPITPRLAAVLKGLPRRGRWVVTAPPSPRYPRGDHQVSGRRLLVVLKRVLGGLSLPGHLHTFRHAFISTALTRGVPEAVVRDWVGHVDRDILRLYTHIASVVSQAAMRRFTGEAEGKEVNVTSKRTQIVRKSDSAQIQHTDQEVFDGSSAK